MRSLETVAKVQNHEVRVAKVDKKMHEKLFGMMWDTITGKADLAVVEVRKARLIECLATTFAAILKNAGLSIHLFIHDRYKAVQVFERI